MKDSVSADGISFFRLPCVFTVTWMIAGAIWIYQILPAIFSNAYYVLPVFQLETYSEWVVYAPLLFIFTSFLFYYRHLCRTDSRSLILVAGMAVIWFIVLKLAGLMQLTVLANLGRDQPYMAPPPVLAIYGLYLLKLLITIAALWLIATGMTRSRVKTDAIYKIAPHNNGIVHNILLTSLTVYFSALLPLILLFFYVSFFGGEEILQEIIMLFTIGLRNILPDLLVLAGILVTALYGAFGYNGEKLRTGRLLLTGLAGGLIVFLMSSGAIYAVLSSSYIRDYRGPDSVAILLRIAGYASMVIAALIIRYMVKRVFRAGQDELHAENN